MRRSCDSDDSKRGAQFLVLLQRRAAHRLADQQRAVDGDRGLLQHGGQRPLVLGRDRLVLGVCGWKPQTPTAPRGRDQGTELEGEIGQGVGAPARRLALGEGPARGADLAGGKIVHRRPGGGEAKFARPPAAGTRHGPPCALCRCAAAAQSASSSCRRGGRVCARNRRAVRCSARASRTTSAWSCTRPASEPVSTATTRNTSSESSSCGFGDGERVDRRDEEEIIGRETTGTTRRSPTSRPKRSAQTSTASRKTIDRLGSCSQAFSASPEAHRQPPPRRRRRRGPRRDAGASCRWNLSVDPARFGSGASAPAMT